MDITNRLLVTIPAAATPEERLNHLRQAIFAALEDGTLTVAELQALREARVALGISALQARTLRAEVYHAALLRAQEDDRLSSEELETLNQILLFFNTLRDER
ncbi:hypothetical protein [Deinococcus humi]|uniref:Tellurite resistance protein n=1 Tax=Deinococcus humi TaxID=662880 RepID=A0A7W8JUH5_9DEIO|nr:hypothetical protein [Deinococcus humi]MBB5363426.1 tellurite resistance protein [Deinococcus humi]GGO26585.1 hypothetical protein GCM10008949_17450 [Deinococcus humi]